MSCGMKRGGPRPASKGPPCRARAAAATAHHGSSVAEPAASRPGGRVALGGVAIAGMVGASYYPSLWGGFVWDDVIFAEEPVIHAVSGLWSIWASPADIRNEGHYWPIVYTTFWLEHKLWGSAAIGYHVVNVVLHAVNSLLVWRLAGRLAVPGAWLIAAVFAVHPVHVESVAWIIERKDLLSALFYLTAMLAWMRYRRRRRGCRRLCAGRVGTLRGGDALEVDRGDTACRAADPGSGGAAGRVDGAGLGARRAVPGQPASASPWADYRLLRLPRDGRPRLRPRSNARSSPRGHCGSTPKSSSGRSISR